MDDNNVKMLPGRGLDVGTGFLVEARMSEDGTVHTKSVRDSFLEIKPSNKIVYGMMKKGLQKAGVNYFEENGVFNVLGEDSLIQSVEKQLIVKRPMEKGVINRNDVKALPMFKALLKELLGEPVVPFEPIVYSIPASPTDAPFDIVYHESVIESILASLGYKGTSMNEAQAIVFSELAEEGDDYTGIAISCGAGMCNVSISNMAECLATFAISKGGDYVDYGAATSLGYDPKDASSSDITPNLITFIKEQGVDVRKITHEGEDARERGAIAAHYQNLIKYIVANLIAQINSMNNKPRFLKPVKIVISGGTSMAVGFLDVFKKELEKVKDELPFEVGAVVHASQPLTAVAEGSLLALLAEME
jgi:hypothetical protein